MPVTRVDLDGDQQLVNAGIDVVLADSKLADRSVPVCRQRSEHARFVSSRDGAQLLGVSAREQRLERVATSASGSLRSSGHRLALGRRASSVGQELLLRHRPLLNAELLERKVDHGATYAEQLGNSVHAQALADVELSDVSIARLPLALDAAEWIGWLLGLGRQTRNVVRALLSKRTQPDAGLAQARLDRHAACAETFPNLEGRQSLVHVEPNDLGVIEDHEPAVVCHASVHFSLSTVTALERVAYDGPVHNFAVDVDESYVVDGVVAHNCLCTVHAVIDRDAFSRPDDDDGQVPEDMQDHDSPDAAGWLAANPDKARAILGPTRHALLEKGATVLEPTGQPKRVGDLLKGSARKAAR